VRERERGGEREPKEREREGGKNELKGEKRDTPIRER
jgi:hypothetical protein